MPDEFQYDAFLSHSATDKAVVRPLPVAAPRESAANSPARQAEEEVDGGALPRRRYAEEIEAGLEHSRVVPLAHRMGEGDRRPGEGWMSNAFGSDPERSGLEAGTFGRGNLPFRDPLNKERRFLPLRLDDIDRTNSTET